MSTQNLSPQSESISKKHSLFGSPARAWTLLMLVFFAVHFVALFSPALLDDADSTHAQAAQHMAQTGNWVTLYVDGIRYLEKPPLPYWMAAIDYHIFGYNVFSTHLPMTLGVLACAILAWFWSRRAYGDRAAFYAALAVLTAVGIFLWTRFLIPESLLTFFLTLALFCFLTGLEDRKPSRFYIAYAAVALALLAKGLIAIVFFGAAIVPYLMITGDWRRWREMRIATGMLLFLAIGAPWHILCGLANPDQGHPVGNIPTPGNVHGFFYFYFINEHFLRFLGKRYPHDYNKQVWYAYWFGQLVWLFPWSIFIPAAVIRAWRARRSFSSDLQAGSTLRASGPQLASAGQASPDAARRRFRSRTVLLLGIYSLFVLVFFSISTNQEYYDWPIWPALLILITGALALMEEAPVKDSHGHSASIKWLNGMHAAFAVSGAAIAAALAWGLWTSRHIPFVSDIGTMLAHRDVGSYSLATSHFFDLTGRSFAALREPAIIAAVALLIGPAAAWLLRRRRHGLEATTTVAFTLAIVLIAAHIALVRFQPMLSSKAMAETINHYTAQPGHHDYQFIIYGDQSSGNSIIFYTNHQALLAHGRSWYFSNERLDDPKLLIKEDKEPEQIFGSSMIWGSDYPDAPHIFMADPGLLAKWGHGARIFLFVPHKFNYHVKKIMADHGKKLYKVQEISDKTLYTDRPLSETSDQRSPISVQK